MDPDPDLGGPETRGSGSGTLVFWVKTLKFFDADPGSGMETMD